MMAREKWPSEDVPSNGEDGEPFTPIPMTPNDFCCVLVHDGRFMGAAGMVKPKDATKKELKTAIKAMTQWWSHCRGEFYPMWYRAAIWCCNQELKLREEKG